MWTLSGLVDQISQAWKALTDILTSEGIPYA
jgi:hypothetical protein